MQRKRVKQIIFLVAAAVLIAAVVAVFMLPHGQLFEWIRRGGYPVLFLLLFCCGIGLPLPEDVPLITAGILIQMGEFQLGLAAVVAWCGIIAGDCVLYTLGKKLGPDIVDVPIIGSHIDAKRLDQVERWFRRWGVWVVAVGRMFAGVRGVMVVVAGTSRFNFVKFIIADGLAAIVSGGVFVFLGYKFAQNRERLKEIVHGVKHGMLIGAIVVVAVIIALIWWRKRSRRDAETEVLPAEPKVPTPTPVDPV